MKKQARVRKKAEEWWPWILALIATIASILWLPDKAFRKMFSESFIGTVITLATVLFGFLLSVLAILASMANNSALQLIQKLGRSNDLLRYNKVAVSSSGLAALFSVFFLLVENGPANQAARLFFHSIQGIWLYLLFLMLFSSIRYVNVFYAILKTTEE